MPDFLPFLPPLDSFGLLEYDSLVNIFWEPLTLLTQCDSEQAIYSHFDEILKEEKLLRRLSSFHQEFPEEVLFSFATLKNRYILVTWR